MKQAFGTLVLAMLLSTPLAVVAEETGSSPPTITVIGQGKAAAPSDMATISTGVVTEAETAQAALEQNNAAMQEVQRVLQDHDIADRDMQTTNFRVRPIYDDQQKSSRIQRDVPQAKAADQSANNPFAKNKRQSEPTIRGYRVENEVQVRVRELDSLGKVLDSLVDAGSNKISSIQFGLNDESDLLTAARERAMRDAKSRAELYAQVAGVRVGAVVQITDQQHGGPEPYRMASTDDLFGAPSEVPMAGGEQEVQVSVQVVYRLEQSGD